MAERETPSDFFQGVDIYEQGMGEEVIASDEC
jgi:hypothetical protein